jgi:hypothetical protein
MVMYSLTGLGQKERSMHRFPAIKRLGAPAFLAGAPNAYIQGANRVLNALLCRRNQVG